MSETYPRPHTELEAAVGHVYDEPELLITALTHSSYSNEMKAARAPAVECNERMEFLGDSVLSLAVSEFLFEKYPELPEGDLSRIRSGVVCEKALGRFAEKISLGDYLLLGHGEELTHGRSRVSILADAFEALLASLYLDGGFGEVKRFLLPIVSDEVELMLENGNTRDYKTLLQQIVQQERGELLEYVIVGESGPMHCRRFEVEARLNSNVIGRGTALSKREAEQLAAKEAVSLFGVKPERGT